MTDQSGDNCVRTFDWDNTVQRIQLGRRRELRFPAGPQRNRLSIRRRSELDARASITWKFGYAFRRDDITDYTSSEHNINYGGGENFVFDQSNFAAGYSDEWAERFPQRLSQPVALYVEGFYGQDQWKVTPGLTVHDWPAHGAQLEPALPHQLRLQLLAGFQLPAYLTIDSL